MDLKDVIELASNEAYEQDSDMLVGHHPVHGWIVAHVEDMGRQAEMTGIKFLVHSDGVDDIHIKNGEITGNWELPE